ncbi:MAG: AAA family ATPase [Puniceicoccales bacterium]|nr:AAA family ATPase [Puniceicoccales bacterium]
MQMVSAQERGIALIRGGKNVWIDGPAGTGKTVFSQMLRSMDGSIVFLAPTGIAAIHAGGMTIHSFLGFGIAPLYDKEVLNKKVRSMGPDARQRLRAVHTLVIDEISMVRADMLDAIDTALRAVFRREHGQTPFGGRQVALIGDIGQLRPIVSREEEEAIGKNYPDGCMFYDAHVFAEAGFEKVEFSENFRQANDGIFAEILDSIRSGQLSKEQLAMLNGRIGNGEDGSIAVVAYRATADAINAERLRAIQDKPWLFSAIRTGVFEEKTAQDIVPEELELRIGTRVMLAVNHPPEYYNGKMATVSGVCRRAGSLCAFVKADDGQEILVEPYTWKKLSYEVDPRTGIVKEKTVGTYCQLPIRLAWAVTVHRSQGLTYERMHIQDPTAFFPGDEGRRMFYVAYSRCPTLAGIRAGRMLQPRHLTRYGIALRP